MINDPTPDRDYEERLRAEASLWGSVYAEQAQTTPPDWAYHRSLRHNRMIHGATIDALLNLIQPGMKTLELGCATGWLTLAMAQRGADATGIELSEDALKVARTYYANIRDRVPGSVTYLAHDVNTLMLPESTYDVIAVKGTLHHLVNLPHVIDQVAGALRPGGLLWVDDSEGDEHILSVLAAGAVCLVLPTETPYREKIRALLRFGTAAPSRVRASIQAEGLSPFEGVSREQSWRSLIADRFVIERTVPHPSITGYVTAQVRLPDAIALPLLYAIRAVDRGLTRLGLLRNTGWILFARKPDR